MKGVIIFDHLNDIIYKKFDQTLRNHLRGLCIREGLIRKENGNGSDISINALVQLFSPLVTSQRVMLNQFNNPYTAVHSQDGTIMTFAEHLGYLFLAVGCEKEESLAMVQRRLHVFHRLVRFLCGPAVNSLKLSTEGGFERQNLLSQLIDTWENFRKEELAYLIEAVEHLLINQYLSTTCMQLLEIVLEKIRHAGQEVTASHAFLLVNTKLLSMFSSHNSSMLTSSDLLTLILLVHTHHPSSRIELPRSPRRSPSPSVCYPQGDPVPPRHPSHLDDDATASRLQVPSFTDGDESSDSEAFFSPCGTPPHVRNIEKVISKLNISEREQEDAKDEHRLASSLEEVNWAIPPSNEEFTKDLLFICTENSSVAPHVVYTMKVMEGVVLVIICDNGISLISGSILDAMDILHDSQLNKQPEKGKQVLDTLETNIRRLMDGIKKLKNPETDVLLKTISMKWDLVKNNGILNYLKSSSTHFMSSRLEASAGSLMELLQEAFQVLCLPKSSASMPLSIENSTTLVDIQALVRFSLADYADYLRIKALRNVTITSYINGFPGLIHFIYVNRSNDQVMVPAIDIKTTMQLNNSSIIPLLKEKILKMVEFTRVQLQLGHFSIVWRDSNFHYSYFLWFEDVKGEPLKPEVFLHGLRNFPPPGILCGDFYKMLRQEGFPDHATNNIQCYELLCMHLATTTVTCIAEQVRHLAATIWELTGTDRFPAHMI